MGSFLRLFAGKLYPREVWLLRFKSVLYLDFSFSISLGLVTVSCKLAIDPHVLCKASLDDLFDRLGATVEADGRRPPPEHSDSSLFF